MIKSITFQGDYQIENEQALKSIIGDGFDCTIFNDNQFKFYMRRKNRVYFSRAYDGLRLNFTLPDIELKTLLGRFKVGQYVSMKIEMPQENKLDINTTVVAKSF